MRYIIIFFLSLYVAIPQSGWAENSALELADISNAEQQLLNMSPAEILNMELSPQSIREYWEENGVTSVSKKGEDPFDSPSAIYVISSEDIKNSGFTSVQEALRMVPGLQVAQMDSNKWAIASRGFNRQTSSKLRILIDGRAVFTPFFSGVFWDEVDLIMQDIERIEIVRGAGGALWGPNTVNGVINIITKSAQSTQGKYISMLYGNEENGTIEARYGSKIDEGIYYRTHAKFTHRDGSDSLVGEDLKNNWFNQSAGVRLDHHKDLDNKWSVNLDILHGKDEVFASIFPQLVSPLVFEHPFNKETWKGSILTKWRNIQSNISDTDVTLYLDYNQFDSIELKVKNLSADISFKHNWNGYDNHDITWGAEFLYNQDVITNSYYLGYSPNQRYNHFYSLFFQDKVTIIPQSLFITVGSKLEHNYFTDFEYQPNVKLTWFPNNHQTVWMAATRAIRVPTRFEKDGWQRYAGTTQGFLGVRGDNDFESEKIITYEIGHRARLADGLILDSTAFYSKYSDLRSWDKNGDAVDDYINLIGITNEAKARSYGVETAIQWQANSRLRLEASYGLFDIKYTIPKKHFTLDDLGAPRHQFNIRSNWKVVPNLDWNLGVYYVDSLEEVQIDGYVRLDSNIIWRAAEGLNISIVGQNLLDDRHQEFSPGVFASSSEIERSLYAKLSWEF